LKKKTKKFPLWNEKGRQDLSSTYLHSRCKRKKKKQKQKQKKKSEKKTKRKKKKAKKNLEEVMGRIGRTKGEEEIGIVRSSSSKLPIKDVLFGLKEEDDDDVEEADDAKELKEEEGKEEVKEVML
jgi:hypothetical protein